MKFNGYALARVLGGRTMTFLWGCLAAATFLAHEAKLTGDYVAVVTLLGGIAAGRALGADKMNGGKHEGSSV